ASLTWRGAGSGGRVGRRGGGAPSAAAGGGWRSSRRARSAPGRGAPAPRGRRKRAPYLELEGPGRAPVSGSAPPSGRFARPGDRRPRGWFRLQDRLRAGSPAPGAPPRSERPRRFPGRPGYVPSAALVRGSRARPPPFTSVIGTVGDIRRARNRARRQLHRSPLPFRRSTLAVGTARPPPIQDARRRIYPPEIGPATRWSLPNGRTPSARAAELPIQLRQRSPQSIHVLRAEGDQDDPGHRSRAVEERR